MHQRQIPRTPEAPHFWVDHSNRDLLADLMNGEFEIVIASDDGGLHARRLPARVLGPVVRPRIPYRTGTSVHRPHCALMRGHWSGHGPRPRAVRRLSEIVRYTFSCEAAHRCTGLTTAGPGDRIGSGNRCESIFFES
jgi:DNA-binding transcriptional LysR family regulator